MVEDRDTPRPTTIPMPQTVRIAVVGDITAPEFSTIREILGDACYTLALGDRLAASELDPTLIVCLQSWSDQYPSHEITALRRACPLARWIVVYGPWCDSDGRSRRVFEDAARIPVGEFPHRWELELNVTRGRTSSRRALPATAARDEIFLHSTQHTRTDSPVTTSLPVLAIVSPDRELRDMVSAIWQQSGGPITTIPTEASVILCDLDPWEGHLCAELRVHTVPILGWAGWPETIPPAEWRAAGIQEVLHKLASPATLQARIRTWGQRALAPATDDSTRLTLHTGDN